MDATTMRTLRPLALLTFGVALGFALRPGGAIPSEPKPKVGGKAHAQYARGYKLAKDSKWAAAHATFVAAQKIEPNDPDVLNMLAFTTRKHTGDTSKAIALYHRALERRKDFPQARAYLAEAHVAAALAQYDALRKQGKKGAAHAADVEATIKHAASTLSDEKPRKLPMKRGW